MNETHKAHREAIDPEPFPPIPDIGALETVPVDVSHHALPVPLVLLRGCCLRVFCQLGLSVPFDRIEAPRHAAPRCTK